MAEKLTPQQKEAVENRGGKLLVSAAAGSGKTKVLVDRLMRYILDPVDPANIDDFLMITYTKAAASELRGKIAAKLSEKVAENPENRHLQRQQQRLYLTKISTVHAFCGDVLREYAYKLDLPADFRVADENECRQLRQTVLEQLLTQAYDRATEDVYFRAFVDSQGLGRDDRLVPQIVEKVYDSARCHLLPATWIAHCQALADNAGITDAAQTEYGAFLLRRLQEQLDLQIIAMEGVAARVALTKGCEKVATVLWDTVYQLQRLRESKTWDAVLANKHVDYGRLVFPRSFGDEALKEQVKAVREACKKGLEKKLKAFSDESYQVLRDLRASSDAIRGLMGLVHDFGECYDAAKKSRRILDFGDLEHKMLDLLLGKSRSGITAAAHEIGSRFREVMVDEYQDSNAVQDAIYGALTQKKQNLFLVGDVKQSIYQFRLADPGIFLEKYASFVPAEQAQMGQGRKVMLSRNFRSSGGVLAGCNDVFRLCMCPEVGGLYYGAEEALYEGVPHVSLGEPETALYCVDVQEETYREEAEFVVSQIQELLSGAHFVRQGDQLRPILPEDIAILLRSPGSAGGYFQVALEKAGIRYATGGGVDLLKTQEIATLRSLLQAVHNPRMDIPLIAALASPLFGFTADDLAAIRANHKIGCFYEALAKDEHEKSRRFMMELAAMRDAMRRSSLTGLLEQIYISTGLEGIYGAMEGGDARCANLQTFYQLAADMEAGGTRDLGRFLEHLDAMEEKGLITAGDQSSPGCVTIMSIHKSKGLEFPVVFLCNLGREFNMESQRASILCHKDMGLGLNAVDNEKRVRYPTIARRAIAERIGAESVSEELRVLYVAMTRARDRLIMTYASKRLEKDIAYIVQRMNAGDEQSLIREAVCPGDWVLLTALHRSEAGALFNLGGYPEKVTVSDIPWEIRVVTAPMIEEGEQETIAQERLPAQVLERLQNGLAFRYGFEAATRLPSKMTATAMKGRVKDLEAAENTQPPKPIQRQWRKPGFAKDTYKGKDYGNAIHAAMQYIDYLACDSEVAVRQELERLVQQRYLSEEQGKIVRSDKIAAFFATEIGQKLRHGNVVREFKFSLLDDGRNYDPALNGEQVLLQGVVDCALIEDDGITVLDFKTDFVTADTIKDAVERYRTQVETYANAMTRIYELPVKKKLLYFFHAGQFEEV